MRVQSSVLPCRVRKHEDYERQTADAIAELVITPTGQRPLRTVVGIDFGVTGFNEATAPFQRGLLEALDMQHMEQPVAVAETAMT